MIKLNICYTFVVMATNCDIIMTSSVIKNSDLKQFKKSFFSGLFLAVLLKYISYYIIINRFILIDMYLFLLFLMC